MVMGDGTVMGVAVMVIVMMVTMVAVVVANISDQMIRTMVAGWEVMVHLNTVPREQVPATLA